MNIHEYQAKSVLEGFGLTIPQGAPILDPTQIIKACDQLGPGRIVVKAQIHAGGRGKAGGVKVTSGRQEAIEVAGKMFQMTLVTHQTGPNGQKVRRVYLEEASAIKKEYYLSAVLNRATSTITFMASSEGGVEIEEVANASPEKIKRVDIDPAVGFSDCHARKLGYGIGLQKEQVAKFSKVVEAIYKVFIEKDASQIEINPLIEDESGDFIVLDAKMKFDENALFKHPDIMALRDKDEENPREIEASSYGLNYIQMDGDIGCMVNGAGLAMATMDIIQYYKGRPANFLDVGGGAKLETVTAAFKIVLSDPKVKAILVNIFGGIMRCDIIAEGVVQAIKDIGITVPLVVRLSGTNFQKGNQVLLDSGLKVVTADNLDDAARKVVSIRNSGGC